MIRVNISDKSDEITIMGHSGYAEHGFDIVCASVSSICITTVNALLSIDEDCLEYKENEGFLKIKLLKHGEVIDALINNMINMLMELQQQYKKFIEIR